MKRLIEFGVRNKLLVNLFSIFFLLAGTMAYISLRKEAFPTFSFDIVTINTSYPGATPKEVEKLITKPLEDELQSVSDLEEVTSVSAEGYSLILVKIDPDADDKDKVVNEIRQSVDRVQDFPSDLEDLPVVREQRTQDTPVIDVTLSGNVTRAELQEIGRQLRISLEDIDGVAQAAKSGWQEEELWIELEPRKLDKYRLSGSNVADAIRNKHVNVPGGTFKGESESLIRTNGEIGTPKELDEVVVRGSFGTPIVRVKDVGESKWAFRDSSTQLRVDGELAITLVVIKKEKYDIIETVEKVEETVERFQASLDAPVKIELINDVSFYVERRLGILLNNGWIGLILVLISLFTFLSFRVAFWTVVGLPLAGAMGIWGLQQQGLTINLISMFAMIMVLGMLVDDAIIVAENVYRKMEAGMKPTDAAIEGAQEVLKPVSVAIMTSIVVFLPLAFMTGIFGKFVYSIPIVVMIMLFASWIESLLVLPSHLAENFKKALWLLTPLILGGLGYLFYLMNETLLAHVRDFFGPQNPDNVRNYVLLIIAVALLALRAFKGPNQLKTLKTLYTWFMRGVLRVHALAVFVCLSSLGYGIYWGIQTTPINLFPSKGIEIFYMRAEAPVGTSLDKTFEGMTKLEALIAKLPEEELKNYVTIAGKIENDPNDPFSNRSSNIGQIMIYLHPEADRDRTSGDIIDQLRADIKTLDHSFDRVWMEEIQQGPPKGKPVAVRIRGDDLEVMKQISARLQGKLADIKGVNDVRDDYTEGKEELLIDTNDTRLAEAGISTAHLARTVRLAFDGEVAAIVRNADEDINIRVRLADRYRSSMKALMNLKILNPQGYLVPLRKIASVKNGQGVNAIRHFDFKRSITVTSGIDESKTTSVEVNETLGKSLDGIRNAFPGYTIAFGGEYEDTQESLDSLRDAFIMAAFLVFIILASTFGSLSQPLLIMLAIPFGLFSAIMALKLHGEPLSFLAMLGMIGLSGVSVNDSIVMIDFINRKREEMDDAKQAVLEACRTRLRPVLLTSITTVAGLAPVAYGIGGMDPFLKPMALAMGWGLAFGTILILILLPCAYLTIDWINTSPKAWLSLEFGSATNKPDLENPLHQQEPVASRSKDESVSQGGTS